MLDTPQPVASASSKLRPRYDNFIGGDWAAPLKGRYFTDKSPIDGSVLCEVARSDASDVERALDAAHAALPGWSRTSPTERAKVLNRIADRIEENLELLARVETRDNGKPIRETINADVPLAADHFRYFAGCIRAEEGTIAESARGAIACLAFGAGHRGITDRWAGHGSTPWRYVTKCSHAASVAVTVRAVGAVGARQ
jgi:aldehyde dehydrogenase